MTTTLSLTPAVDNALRTAAPSGAPANGATRGAIRTTLRLEAAAILAASVAVFHALGGSWALFAALFLVPDVSLLGYLAGPRVGAPIYNAAHSLLGPLALAAVGVAIGGVASPLLPIAAIWVAHVGFDRMLGYGLKYAAGFRETHLSTASGK